MRLTGYPQQNKDRATVTLCNKLFHVHGGTLAWTLDDLRLLDCKQPLEPPIGLGRFDLYQSLSFVEILASSDC